MAKAWVLHEIGDIRLEDVDIPVPAENEVLVNVKAVGICGSDVPRVYETGAHRMPLVPGHEFSGVVVKTGTKVSADLEGMRVAVSPKIPCRKCEMCAKGETDLCLNYDYTGSRRDGAFGEYVCVPVDNLIELVDNISFEEGAMIEPLAVAANAVRTGCAGIDPADDGVKIAVCGMGTIGLMVVMLLKDMGFSDIYVIGNKDSQRDKAIDLGILPENYCDMRTEDPVMWIKEKTDELFCSFDIPSGANKAKDFIYYKFFSPSLFSSCSIVFDDGRSLRYPRENNGSRQLIPAYSKDFIDGICVWTFTITDEHYRLAE